MKDKSIVKKVIDYIECHLQEDLSLDQIAKKVNYSKFYIARSFVEETGTTIYKYIQGRRLTLVAQMLVETQKTIMDIAYEANYHSQQAFTLAFHKVYLCSPLDYRKNGIFYPLQRELMTKKTCCLTTKTFYMGGSMAA